ncbi:hypothetical protein [Pseudokineococcus sp. 1T1Z-3]|uniref:hypothetical protein n=1 Tax=Pseudokineococcus sp. 1T1Z-3 TaxID=3132745 RepID=UPI0030AE9EE6
MSGNVFPIADGEARGASWEMIMASKYERRGPVTNSYNGGFKTRSYNSGSTWGGPMTPKKDIYSNNGGPGHSHKVKTGNGFTTFSRPGPRGTPSMSLAEAIFGPIPGKKKKRR